MFSTIYQKGVQVFHAGVQGIQAGVQGIQAGLSALVQGGASAIKSKFESTLSEIGEIPPPEDVVEMVKNALNEKLRDKKKEFIYLLKDEFITWLRIKKPEKSDLISKIENAIFLLIEAVKRVKFFVNIEKVESIVNEKTEAITKANFPTDFSMYIITGGIIQQIISEALIPTGEPDFEKKRKTVIDAFRQVIAKELQRIMNGSRGSSGGSRGGSGGGGGGTAGGGGGGGGNARRRGLKSRRRNRKQRKTRKQK